MYKYNIHTHHLLVFKLCMTKKKERRTKLKFLRYVFLTLRKIRGTYKADLAIELYRDVVCELLQ